MSSHSRAFSSSALCSLVSAGTSFAFSRVAAATFRVVGITSLDDWPMFTSSLGCTGDRDPSLPPTFRMARLLITSLAFMLLLVPLPVWKISTTNWLSCLPLWTSSAASMIAATSLSLPLNFPSFRFATAHAFFTSPRLCTKWGCMVRPEMPPSVPKFSTARWVWAPYMASSGTCISPMLSFSARFEATTAALRRTEAKRRMARRGCGFRVCA
mmetsp:Transcript_38767/g.93081  ORF Transcript_38767/g.93081 Transcript_38767/m.93081 type:complete len:212 (-) Transcript_38767:15-650(-)